MHNTLLTCIETKEISLQTTGEWYDVELIKALKQHIINKNPENKNQISFFLHTTNKNHFQVD